MMFKKIRLTYLITLISCLVIILVSLVSSIVVDKVNKIQVNSFTTNCSINSNGDASISHSISINSTYEKKMKDFSFKLNAFGGNDDSSSYLDISTLYVSYSGVGNFGNERVMFSSSLYENQNTNLNGKKLSVKNGADVIYIGAKKGYLNYQNSNFASVSININYTIKNAVKSYDDYAYFDAKILGDFISSKNYTFSLSLPSYKNNAPKVKEKIIVQTSTEAKKYLNKSKTNDNSYRIEKNDSKDENRISNNINCSLVLGSKRFYESTTRPNYLHKNSGNIIFARANLNAMNHFNDTYSIYPLFIIILNIIAFVIYNFITNYNIKYNILIYKPNNKLNPVIYHMIKGDLKYDPREIVNYLIYHAKILIPSMKNNKMFVSFRFDSPNNDLTNYFKKVVNSPLEMHEFYDFLRRNKKEVINVLGQSAIENKEINTMNINLFSIILVVVNIIIFFVLGFLTNGLLRYFTLSINLLSAIILAFTAYFRSNVSIESRKDYAYYHLYKNKGKIKDIKNDELEKYEQLIPYSTTLKYDADLIYLAENEMGSTLGASKIARSHLVIEYLLRGHY